MEKLEKIVIAQAITKNQIFLQFTGMEDVKELISFTGVRPKVTDEGLLQVKKWILNPPCLIHCDNVGNIQNVLSPTEFEKGYEVKETKVYSDSFAAKKPTKK